MPTNFDTNFIDYNDDIIRSDHVTQFASPINNLENGSALYSDDDGSPNSFKLDFSSGNVLSEPLLLPGQVINFKAKTKNLGASHIVITGPAGELAPIPLLKNEGAELQSGDIQVGQTVTVIYLEDDAGGNGRFQLLGFFEGLTRIGDLLYTYEDPVTGFVQANGQLLDQVSYPELYALIGLIKDGGPDLQSWVEKKLTTKSFYDVAYGNGVYVVVGDSGLILTSPDGNDWRLQASGSTTYIRGIVFANGVFHAVTGDQASNFGVLTSTDGKIWEFHPTPEIYSSGFSGPLHYIQRTFFAGGNGKLWRSENGISDWQEVLQSQSSGWTVRGVAYGNGVYVAVGLTNAIYWSTDGLTWTLANTGQSQPPLSVAFGAGKFVILGSGKISTSTNGVTWASQSLRYPADLNSVLYVDGQFVALGPGGVWTSPNGTTWSAVATGFGSSGAEVAVFGDGRIVLCSGGGFIAVSGRGYSYDPQTQFRLPIVSPIDPNSDIKAWIRAL